MPTAAVTTGPTVFDVAKDRAATIAYRRYVEPTSRSDPAALRQLGEAMLADAQPVRTFGPIPAGYTYLGQFLFHDFTWLDLATGEPRNRTNGALDLTSVTGKGAHRAPGGLLAVGRTEGSGGLPEDLPRAASGCPMIADARNDDYLPLAQMHLLMIKFHNAMVEQFGGAEGRRQFVLHVQQMVVEDYLRRVCDPGVLDDVLQRGRAFIHPEPFQPGERFEVPLEFAGAAARFGHAMIRDEYPAWNNVRYYPSPGNLEIFIKFSNRNRRSIDGYMRRIDTEWVTNWHRLFDFSDRSTLTSSTDCLFAAPIGTNLRRAFASLPAYTLRDGESIMSPGATINLASHTLGRQARFFLADAQSIIAGLNKCLVRPVPVLSPGEIAASESNPVARALNQGNFLTATPLWFYILKEARLHHGGARLGLLGSRLVMETVHAAIAAAETSLLKLRRPWVPRVLTNRSGYFTMPDLIAFSTNPEPGVPERPARSQARASANDVGR